MKERLSDVLAWFGFGYVVFTYSILVFTDMGRIYVGDLMYWLGFNQKEFAFDTYHMRIWIVYIGCAVANYIVVGRLRLLPWQGIKD